MADNPFALSTFISPNDGLRRVDVRAPIDTVVVMPPSTRAGTGTTVGPSIQPSQLPIAPGFFGDLFRGLTGGQTPGEFAGATIRRGFAPVECTPPRLLIAGNCVDPTAILPGGDPFVVPEAGRTIAGGGGAVVGSFGIPAIMPIQVAQPTLRCPPGAVLGKDSLCYMKTSIPKAFRKWRPAPKPPMSAADAKALRRIGTLQGKVKRLAKSANLTCKRK